MSTQRAEILSVPNHLFPSRTPHAHNLRFWVTHLRLLAFEIEQTDYSRTRELQSLSAMRNAPRI